MRMPGFSLFHSCAETSTSTGLVRSASALSKGFFPGVRIGVNELTSGDPSNFSTCSGVMPLWILSKGGKRPKHPLGLGLCGADAVLELISAIKDKNGDVRWCCIRALSLIGPPAKAAIPPLKSALGDSDRNVRQLAAYALEKIEP